MKIEKFKKARIYKSAGFLYAEKDGHCVLKGESTWKKINGFFINTESTGFLCIQFRRVFKLREL